MKRAGSHDRADNACIRNDACGGVGCKVEDCGEVLFEAFAGLDELFEFAIDLFKLFWGAAGYGPAKVGRKRCLDEVL